MKKMHIRIGKDGKVKLDVEGAIGPECREFTKLFEQAVGEVESCRLKPEIDQVKEDVQQHEEAGG